jgi:hypothetical protein
MFLIVRMILFPLERGEFEMKLGLYLIDTRCNAIYTICMNSGVGCPSMSNSFFFGTRAQTVTAQCVGTLCGSIPSAHLDVSRKR